MLSHNVHHPSHEKPHQADVAATKGAPRPLNRSHAVPQTHKSVLIGPSLAPKKHSPQQEQYQQPKRKKVQPLTHQRTPVKKVHWDLTLVLDRGANDSHVQVLKVIRPTLDVWVVPDCAVCECVCQFLARYPDDVQFRKHRGRLEQSSSPVMPPQCAPRIEYRQPGKKRKSGDDESDDESLPINIPLPKLSDGAPMATLERRLRAHFVRRIRALHPHQCDLLEAFARRGSLQERHAPAFTVFWEMGSGKTLGAVAVMLSQASPRNIIVCNNTNVAYWVDHLKMMTPMAGTGGPTTTPPPPAALRDDIVMRFEVVGYTAFRAAFDDPSALDPYTCVVLDEAHYFRNSTAGMQSAMAAIHGAKNVLMLTGTPLVNAPDDVVGMLALADMDKKHPWEKQFAAQDSRRLPSPARVAAFLQNNVSWFDPRTHRPNMHRKFYPGLEDHVIRVPMTYPQTLEYFMALRSVFEFGPYTVQQGRSNRYNCLTRAVCNAPRGQPHTSPKLHAVLTMLRRGLALGPQVVHSSLVETGVAPLRVLCEREQLTDPRRMQLITGSTPIAERERIRQAYNRGKIDVLFISDASQFGMDLAATAAIHLVEPHQNRQNENQTTARAVRMGSHIQCPYKTVQRYKYVSTFPDLATITEADVAACRTFMVDQAVLGTNTAALLSDVDIAKVLRQKIREEGGQTINERQEEDNVRKHAMIEPYLEAFRTATIPMTTQEADTVLPNTDVDDADAVIDGVDDTARAERDKKTERGKEKTAGNAKPSKKTV